LRKGSPIPPKFIEVPTPSDPARRGMFLQTDDGDWAGAIRFHNRNAAIASESSERSLSYGAKHERVELIVLATGKVRNNAFPKSSDRFGGSEWTIAEWECEDRPKQDEFYRFYFVLNVEWVEGIAYRRGLGRVEKNT
jgi:hypothetical protein